MYNQGKLGICLECGSVYKSEENQDLAYKSVLQFLKYFGAISGEIEFSKKEKRIVEVFEAVKKKTDNFNFVRDFADFEKLKEGEVFAQDGDKKYIAKKNECIIFPNSNKKIGEEVFILGKIN
jgi:succinylglutamate desuccinylase